MKTKLIALITVMMLGNTTMNANNGTGETTESQIQKQLSIQPLTTVTPKNTDVKIEVLFTTNEKGEVDMAIAKTQDTELKNAIEKGFMKLMLKNTKPNVCYGITIKLKTL